MVIDVWEIIGKFAQKWEVANRTRLLAVHVVTGLRAVYNERKVGKRLVQFYDVSTNRTNFGSHLMVINMEMLFYSAFLLV